ncbi:SusC/RagA family TonB-linked outer membrane protein [Fulvivirga ligni]|uniref:SusC/RagA family TonB-linked outer membrane protein n=1 Tax=Fulvivirga ligni TaxID=2904246 RepID=UPI001F3B5B78|nr:TonB-dependent receptor [Fulvivirga ligni]UII19349.1 TonB-dependent receptor [Fulvivirga ligni]
MKYKILKKILMLSRWCLYIFALHTVFFSFAAAESKSQQLDQINVSVKLEHGTVIDVFSQIEMQSRFKFAYESEDLPQDITFNFEGNQQSIAAILTQVGKKASLNFRRVNNKIDVARNIVEAEPKIEEVIVEKTVTGTVHDEDGNPLPGVNILIQGTTKGTITDFNGAFTLDMTDNQNVLIFSFIGYVKQEVALDGRTSLNITMQPDVTSLTEVVVIGYGTQEKSDVTGSVASITEEDFNPGQVTSPDQLISGKVAGVQITSNGGAPGSGGTIRIRGGSSLNASNDPLIVLDGVPLDNNGVAGSSNPLSFINPNDIESVNVLKDASATAIYGSRASNGVLIINTKKGKADQEMRVNFRTLTSVSQVTKTVDLLSADEFRTAVQTYASEEQQALLGDADTDWQDEIYKTAVSSDNNLSVMGAYKGLPYRVSVGYLNQDGILKTSNLQRTSGALSLNPSLFDNSLKINLNLKGIYSKSRFADQTAISSAVAYDPTQPVFIQNDFGNYFQWVGENGTPNTQTAYNPVSILAQRGDYGEAKRSIGNLQLDYTLPFLKELKANLNLGYDISESEGSITLPANAASVFAQGGSFNEYSQSKSNLLLDFYLNYKKDLENLNSAVDFTAGYSYQDFEIQNDTYPVLNIEGDTIRPAAIATRPQYRLKSYFGRLNYTFKDKYLLTATVRADGSSRFSEDNRWGLFPSLALAWKIDQESFLVDSKTVSQLKLRVGYGITGQQDFGEYFPYLPRYTQSNSSAQYQFGNEYINTLRPEGYDSEIKWEETTTYNAGIDFGFWNDRLSGSLDYYFKRTDDLLAFIPPAAGTNLTNQIFTNVGSIENRGIELGLNFNAISGEKFEWDFGINATYNTTEITSLSKVQNEDSEGIAVGGIGGGTGNTIQIHTVGNQPFAFYVYQQVYDENGNPVEGVYVDQNNDNLINEQDKYRYKSPAPKVYFGFNNTFSYDKWSLSFLLRGSLGNYVYNNINSGNAVYSNLEYSGYLTNLTANVLETNFRGTDSNRLFSDYYIENASFVRMENISLTYQAGRFFNEKLGLQLNANVQNAFVITKYSGLDPEISGGIDNNFYPRPRVYSLGVTVDF